MKIYIAPSKALVQEKLRDWNQKLGSLGINCLELTGDNEFYNIRNIQEADIIVTTPEVRCSILYIHMFAYKRHSSKLNIATIQFTWNWLHDSFSDALFRARFY